MQAPVANKGGRPSKSSDAIAGEICDRLSKGEPLAVMCREPHMPQRSTVYCWCESYPEFAARYRMAREIGFDWLAAECLEIAAVTAPALRTRQSLDGTWQIAEGGLTTIPSTFESNNHWPVHRECCGHGGSH